MRVSLFAMRCGARMLAALRAVALFAICLAITASVREMHVRLDVVGREVARGAPMRAMRAGACECAAPIIPTVQIIRAFSAPAECGACDHARRHERDVSAIAFALRLRVLLAFALVGLVAFAWRCVAGAFALLCVVWAFATRSVVWLALALLSRLWPRLVSCIAARVAGLPPRIILWILLPCVVIAGLGEAHAVPVCVALLRLRV